MLGSQLPGSLEFLSGSLVPSQLSLGRGLVSSLLPQGHRPASWAPKSWVWEPRVVEGPMALTHSTGPVGLFAEVTWVAKVGDGAGQGARDEGINHELPRQLLGWSQGYLGRFPSAQLPGQSSHPKQGLHQPCPTAPGRGVWFAAHSGGRPHLP